MNFKLQVIMDSLPMLFAGLNITVQVIAISTVIALILGLVAGLMTTSTSKIARNIAYAYINVIRGTPLLVQIFFIYFGLPSFLGIKIPAMVAGIAAVSLNAGAYNAETFRAGIQSIDRGQMEAARSIGFSKFQAMRLIILPQAIRRMIPALMNQFIISLKDTSLLSIIGIRELAQSGQIVIASTYRAFEIWFAVGLIYFILIYILSKLSYLVERRYMIK